MWREDKLPKSHYRVNLGRRIPNYKKRGERKKRKIVLILGAFTRPQSNFLPGDTTSPRRLRPKNRDKSGYFGGPMMSMIQSQVAGRSMGVLRELVVGNPKTGEYIVFFKCTAPCFFLKDSLKLACSNHSINRCLVSVPTMVWNIALFISDIDYLFCT